MSGLVELEVGFHNDVKPDHFVTTPAGTTLTRLFITNNERDSEFRMPEQTDLLDLLTIHYMIMFGNISLFRVDLDWIPYFKILSIAQQPRDRTDKI